MRRPTLAVLAALLTMACGGGPRFRDAPPVWRVDDTRDIPAPEKRAFSKLQYFGDIFALRRLTRALELRDLEPAHDVNALEEVPASSWFEPRIGVRTVSPDEAARGPGQAGPPRPPLLVVGGKSGGWNPGFIAQDASGRRWLVKFDTHDNPEMQSAADVIVSRLLWVAGYQVPADYVFTFERDQLELSPKAKIEEETLEERAMTIADVETVLRTSPRRPDGAYRALGSEFLSGRPLGGFPAEGVRGDDPNDRIPHEHRRSLRGLRVLAAWLHHSDMRDDNTLDMLVHEDGRHFVRHYLLDFGEALGSHVAEKGRPEDGFEHFWDWQYQPAALASFGLWKRPWEDVRDTAWLSVGSFAAEPFDPPRWREAYPYWPFTEMDPTDAFWGARLVMRFDRPLIEAVVAEARLSHPEAAAYLVRTLLARRDAIGRAWLEALSPLDEFQNDGRRLCAVDLGIRHGLATSGVVERLDDTDKVVDRATAEGDGRVCLAVSGAGYRVDRLRVRRGGVRKPVMQVHSREGAVLGIVRQER